MTDRPHSSGRWMGSGGAMQELPRWNTPKVPGTGVPARTGSHVLQTLGVVIVAIAALYFGQDILIPLALAGLLSFALAPLVTRIRRLGVPRAPAVLSVTVLAFIVIGAIGALVGSQLVNLAQNLPTYEQNIRAKVISLRAASENGSPVERIQEMAHDLGADIAAGSDAKQAAKSGKPPAPVVRVEQPEPSPWQVFTTVATPLLGPLGTAGIVVVLVIFMLLEREDLRDRMIRLFGRNLSITTEAMDDAAGRVSRYLLMQLFVNATYGIPIGVGLYFIGVPNAVLWGVLATLLRFIPYVGPFVAALFPVTLALAVDSGWNMLLWTLALFVVIELISNNLIEPRLYGASTGMSALAVIVAAIFWTVLWGPVGLFLSTPLTVCLAVIGRYVPQLHFLDVVLGSAPALTPAERFYQRMLAGDPDEGIEIAEHYLEQHTLAAFYDEIVRPALTLSAQDRQSKAQALERRAIVIESFLHVISDLADPDDRAEVNDEIDDGKAPEPGRADGEDEPLRVLCVAGRNGVDLAASAIVAQLFEQRGVGAQVLSAQQLSSQPMRGGEAPEWLLISHFGNPVSGQARATMRRLRKAYPSAKLAVGLWAGQPLDGITESPAGRFVDVVFNTTFAEATDAIALELFGDGDDRLGAPAAPSAALA